MYFEFKILSLSGNIIDELSAYSTYTITDLLYTIENKLNLKKIPFSIIFKDEILKYDDDRTLNNIIKIEQFNILTIIQSEKVPEKFNDINDLIDYINKLCTSNYKYLEYLMHIYTKYENYSIKNNILFIENKDFILNFIKRYKRFLLNTSPNLLNDKEFIITLIQTNYYDLLKYASYDLLNNEEFIISIVTEYGYALKYASKNLQNNKNIVIIAIQNYKEAVQYASEDLQNDEEIIRLL
jgi:hypothetical protein